MGSAAAIGTTINAVNNSIVAPVYYNAAYGSLPPVAAPVIAAAPAVTSSQTVVLP